MTPTTALVVVAFGVVVGIVSALFGVGGGILMVPFIVLFLDKGQHLAEGTSLVVIVPTAIAGVAAHRRSHPVRMRNAALLGGAGLVGAVVGARLALVLAGGELRLLFAIVVAIVGSQLVVRGLRAGGAADQ